MRTINKIGLGSVQFGMDYGISNKNGITNYQNVKAILDYAESVGINFIDTAFGYGESEIVLGKAGVGNFEIISKFLPEAGNCTVEKQINTSLKRLKVKSLYGMLAHRPGDVLENPQIWKVLSFFKKNKKIKKIGFSFNTVEELNNVLNAGYRPDIVQVPYNYFDSRFVPYFKYFKNNNCEVHIRSVFLQGLFFTNIDDLSVFFDEAKPEIKKLQLYGEKLPGMLLKYCLKSNYVDKVIIGVNTKQQLVQSIDSVENSDDLPLKNVTLNQKILMPSQWPKHKINENK